MSTIKFYKDSNGAFRLTDCTGKLAYINKGDIVSAYAENGVCSMIFSDEVYNRFTNIHNKNTAITDFVNASSVAYNEAGLNAVLSDFFVKSAGGISSGVEVINALGYTPADNAELPKKASRKGGTIYHSAKWFIPNANQTITISSDGLSATLANPVINFQFTSAMASALMEVNGVENIISTYTSSSIVIFATAWPSIMRGQVYSYSQFGVYSRAYVSIYGTDENVFYSHTGVKIICTDANGNYISSSTYASFNNLEGARFGVMAGYLGLALGTKIVATDQPHTGYQSTPDIGLRRGAIGVWEINDGVTSGAFRDLNLRNLNYTGALNNTSDSRLKENITEVSDGLEKTILIHNCIKHWTYKNQDGSYALGVQTGPIAQLLRDAGFTGHVKERLPKDEYEGSLFGWKYASRTIVDENGDAILDENGNEKTERYASVIGENVLTVDAMNLVWYLFPAIVELNDKITAIEERLNKAGL